MPVTTVLSDEGSATIVSPDNDNAGMFAHRFSWSAALAGAFVATAVTVLLLILGAGFGLSLVSVGTTATPAFLTLGAIYFVAAQAFGFGVGGHLAGRLIGPAPETAKEEEFRSAAHGLVVWALTIAATAALIVIGGMAAGNTTLSARANSGDAAQSLTPAYVGYWVDLLFRPGASPSQASLALHKYAQADTGIATDGSPAPAQQPQPSPDFSETTPPAPAGSPHNSSDQATPTPAPNSTGIIGSGPTSPPPASATDAPSRSAPRDIQILPQATTGFAAPASVVADKAEASRIITVGMADDARLNQYDKDRLAALIVQDTGLSAPEAQRRVDNAENRIHAEAVQTAQNARKIASHASLWIAFSLLFGAFVAGMAAMSARWEDDTVTFGWPRREPE